MKRQGGRPASRPATVAGYVGLVVLMSAGAATGLSGSNTVYSDDIVDRSVTEADLGTNSVSRVKIQDNAVSGPEVIDGSLTGADVRDGTVSSADLAPGSVGRSELALEALSDAFIQAAQHSLSPGQSGSFTVTCPDDRPVVVSGGYSFSAGAGFTQWASFPTSSPIRGVPETWTVSGANSLPQSKVLTVTAVCVAVG